MAPTPEQFGYGQCFKSEEPLKDASSEFQQNYSTKPGANLLISVSAIFTWALLCSTHFIHLISNFFLTISSVKQSTKQLLCTTCEQFSKLNTSSSCGDSKQIWHLIASTYYLLSSVSNTASSCSFSYADKYSYCCLSA